ncbi:gamma-tubulin complex component 3 [Anthonomus grandis grandis]|uniref:gamma-tubulin complex component 3 n=1 Tax=Anthonomus grandis grandis TaxID=2921223 RepID=UPI002166BAF6|nr:gamma-tubulin complex component 3 [Anthonomus grandis grandis]
MNNVKEDSTIPDLVIKLCKHLARQNEELVSRLSKIAFQCLTGAPGANPIPSEEPYVVNQLREYLKGKSIEDLDRFDLMYSTLANSRIIRDRTSVLKFLYNITLSSKEPMVLAPSLSNSELTTISTRWPSSKTYSRLNVRSSSESASIRQVFDRGEHRFTTDTTTSAVGRATSQATTISSAAWSQHEMPTTSSKGVTEQELLQDVIYSLQGIQGKFLRREPCGMGYTLDVKSTKSLTPVQRGLLERIMGMSFLHKQLKQYCEENEKRSGAICQAFIATLNSELSEYYKTVAMLQSNLSKNNLEHMTLRRVLYMLLDHRNRFEWLAYIAEQCSDKKGGALITVVHGFLQHGSKTAQQVSEKVLKAVCKPLYIMLSRWLLDGEINDPCNEFFIEAKNVLVAERLWHDKYNVRKSMIPSFINMEQAQRILATGKSINFLRQICRDGGQLPGREALHKLFNTTSAEALFTPEQSIEFHSTLENVYKETSLRVLDLLKNKFHLYEHLQSLRRYLLLGQGDFIRHLLELLSPELNKQASEIYGHTLSAILESAIRVTNAQFEDEDTLKRLNISFMSHSIGDLGWEVFSLVYIVDGPIGTIFQPTMPTYQSLFGALWKAKRAEFILANMRRQQLSMAKLFRKIKELKPVMHIIHILTSKMIHFIHQTQYYFLFEVLECSWAEMQNQVNKAECLDGIIEAHVNFLSSVQRGVLLDESSRQLFSHLVSVYNFVVNMETQQKTIYEAAQQEFDAYVAYRKKTESTERLEITAEMEAQAKLRVAKFHLFLNSTKTKVRSDVEMYDRIVKKFLEFLASSSNMKLQLLSVRLSFNNFYKIA